MRVIWPAPSRLSQGTPFYLLGSSAKKLECSFCFPAPPPRSPPTRPPRFGGDEGSGLKPALSLSLSLSLSTLDSFLVSLVHCLFRQESWEPRLKRTLPTLAQALDRPRLQNGRPRPPHREATLPGAPLKHPTKPVPAYVVSPSQPLIIIPRIIGPRQQGRTLSSRGAPGHWKRFDCLARGAL